MSKSLRVILTELAQTVGREHLLEHISALPLDGADAEGETEAEKLAKRNPLNDEEAKLLAKLKARQEASDTAAKEDAAEVEPEAETQEKEAS